MSRCGSAYHSGLMLAPRINLPYFSVSSAISFPKSAGVPPIGAPPKSTTRAGRGRGRLTTAVSPPSAAENRWMDWRALDACK
jgi:hypothetical protein